MKINCLCCGHSVILSEAYDDYEGEIKCYTCGALLLIKAKEASIKSVKFVKVVRPTTEEEFERTH